MSFVRTERDGHVAKITIDRPDRMNALDRGVLEELAGAFASIDAEVRAVVLTGEGKAFVAGADIDAMKDMSEAEAREFSALGHATLARIEALHAPVIAAVNGFALGGGLELAMACDFIYASKVAQVGQPEVKLGVIPGFGGTQRLLRRVGVAMARELVYTGRRIGVDEAHRIGLVNKVYEPAELLPKTMDAAREIAAMGPRAIAIAKRVILDGADLSLPVANEREVAAFAECFTTADQKEGMAAFLEKRAASFVGR
jgi:enoyl-CoA hydratase